MFKKIVKEFLLLLSELRTRSSVHEVAGSIPCLAQWIKYPGLLWLWHRWAVAALISPQAWELTYATGCGLKKKNVFVTSFISLYMESIQYGSRYRVSMIHFNCFLN